jgi:hypothetical protein
MVDLIVYSIHILFVQEKLSYRLSYIAHYYINLLILDNVQCISIYVYADPSDEDASLKGQYEKLIEACDNEIMGLDSRLARVGMSTLIHRTYYLFLSLSMCMYRYIFIY